MSDVHNFPRVGIGEQAIRSLILEVTDIKTILNNWAGKSGKPKDRYNHINSRVAPNLVTNLVTPKDDLNPIIEMLTRISKNATLEQNNIRALVQTYWGQFKIAWEGGNGSWTQCRDIVNEQLHPTILQLKANEKDH